MIALTLRTVIVLGLVLGGLSALGLAGAPAPRGSVAEAAR